MTTPPRAYAWYAQWGRILSSGVACIMPTMGHLSIHRDADGNNKDKDHDADTFYFSLRWQPGGRLVARRGDLPNLPAQLYG
ncbi:hypothetical protein HME01_21360 [Vreelandella aquamarina]|uniref:Uncharacterized protein n=1 Tax=Vreelandella aquamarina TaxID=77097 RepID=A0A6F8SSY5_9GAMM|nr:hypothetical protein HMSLTHF_12990 [Halomonas meridiana]BCB69795.1 hypothetical protein HMEPL2_01460 [Halomonas meridiana]GED46284.1 hypothetical protein HME01_21360 [Halomonas meridiana]